MMAAAEILDLDHFRHMTGDDEALQAEIVALFRGQAQLWRRLMIPDAPMHTWRDAVHTVKGSARSLGLWALADACARAEEVTAGCTPGLPQIAAALAEVQTALSNALEALPENPDEDS